MWTRGMVPALCFIAVTTLVCDPQKAQARTLVDEIAALSWEKSMHITNEADYAQTLQNLIRRAIDSGRGLEEKDGDGRTPLHWAAAIGNQELVAELLKAGADANSSCRYVGQTPLYMATRWGRVEAVQVLLQYGADPHKPDKFGKNAFDALLASPESNARMQQLLMQHSA